MDKMTDARAVEVLAEMREDGGAVSDADYTAAIDRAVARLREPAGVGGGWRIAKAASSRNGDAWEVYDEDGSGGIVSAHDVRDWVVRKMLDRLAAAPQPPAEAQADEVVCLECGQPTMHMGQVCYACSHPAAKPAEAQAQGGGEVGDEDLRWCDDIAESLREAGGPTNNMRLVALNRLLRHARTAPPSAPVGVEGLVRDLVCEIERNTCTHEETHRGGVLWEICDLCGAKWADDRGGKPEFQWPDCIERAHEWLAQQPASAWQAIVEACVITEAVTPDATDPRGTLHRLIDYHVALDRDQQPAAMDAAMPVLVELVATLAATGTVTGGRIYFPERQTRELLKRACDALAEKPGGSDNDR